MKLINQSYEICNQTDFSISGIYKHIEKCTRVAYKSEDKITEDSAVSFINKLLNMKHLAPMEFGTIHFKIPTTLLKIFAEDLIFCNLYNIEWIKCKTVDNYVYFTTNYRHWLELEKKVSYIREYFDSEDNEYYPKRYTVKLITNRAVSHEVVRHRTMSFIQESQRYVSSCAKRNIKEFNCNCIEDICNAYKQGFSAKEISLNSSFSESTIFNKLKENNISIRGLNARGNIISNYFSNINTPEKAYLLGIMQTDGSIVTKKDHITQHKDYAWYLKIMLEEFKDKITDSKDNNCRHLQLGNKTIVDDLISYGIVPNKTYEQTDEDIDTLWNSIPEKFKSDFIRGLIDGDGNVSYFIQKRGVNESCNIGFVSIKERLIDILIDYIYNKFNYKCGKDKEGNIYKLRITDYKKSLEIGKFLYTNFKYPFGHPKKASAWISRIGDSYEIANFKDQKFIMVLPSWNLTPLEKFMLIKYFNNCEDSYRNLRLLGWKPQQARVVLPNSTKTELYMCGFKEAWEHFFELRDNKIVDPQMYDLAHPMHQEFIDNKYL